MKIFNLSPHRSGTQSVTAFLKAHEFKVAHWPGGDFALACEDMALSLDTSRIWDLLEPIVNRNDVFSDLPYCMLYREAHAAFPDAKFILVLRDQVKWVRSVRKLMKDRDMNPLAQIMYRMYSNSISNKISDYSDGELYNVYHRHIASVTDFMASRKADFGIFTLNSPNLAAQIGDFIGFSPVGHIPFRDFLAPEVKQKTWFRSMAWSLASWAAK